jgi:hypothetical protein
MNPKMDFGMKAVPPKRPAKGAGRWICVYAVKHWRSGKLMVRHDGLPFRFRVR